MLPLKCEHKEEGNQHVLKSEHEEEDNQHVLKSEHEEDDNQHVLKSEHEEENNQLVLKSEQEEEGNQLALKSEQKEEDNQLVLKSEEKRKNKLVLKFKEKVKNKQLVLKYEDKEEGKQFFLKSEEKEEDDQFILQYEQKKEEHQQVLKSVHNEPNIRLVLKFEKHKQTIEVILESERREENKKLILKYKQIEQNSKVILKSEQNEQNHQFLSTSEQKEKNFTYALNRLFCREVQNTNKSSRRDTTNGFSSCPKYLQKIPQVEHSFANLNVYIVCKYSLFYVSKKTRIKHQNSCSFDDKSCLPVKLLDIIWLQMLRNLTTIGRSVVEDGQENARISRTSSKSDKPSLMGNSMNTKEKFSPNSKNSMYFVCGEISLRRKCLFRCKNTTYGNNSEILNQNDAFMTAADNFYKEAYRFPPVHIYCCKLHQVKRNRIEELNYDQDNCFKYDLIVIIEIFKTYVAVISSNDLDVFYREWENSPVFYDEVRGPAKTIRTRIIRDAKRYQVGLHNSAGIKSLIEDVNIGYRRTAASSVKENNPLGIVRSITNDEDFSITAVSLFPVRNENQVCVVCYTRQNKTFFRKLKLGNKNTQCDDFICHVLGQRSRNEHFHNFNSIIWESKQLNKLQNNLEVGIQNSCRHIGAIIAILYIEVPLDKHGLHYDINVFNEHHNILYNPHNYQTYSSKQYSLPSPYHSSFVAGIVVPSSSLPFQQLEPGSHTKQFPELGRITSKNSFENKTIPPKYLTCIKTGTQCSSFVGKLDHFSLASAGSDRTQHKPVVGGDSSLTDHYYKKQYLESINTATNVARILSQLAIVPAKTERTQAKHVMDSCLGILDYHKQSNIWTKILRYTINVFCQCTEYRQVWEFFVENSIVVTDSRLVKGKQVVEDFVQNSKVVTDSRLVKGSQVVEDFVENSKVLKDSRPVTGRQAGKDFLENSKDVIESGPIKGRQPMISGSGPEINENKSRSETSENERIGSETTVSVAGTGDNEESSEGETSEEDHDEITTTGRRIKDNIECMDNFLIIWHSGFLILFLFLLGIGIILRVYFSTIIEQSVKSSPNYVLYSHFVKIDNVPDRLEFGNLDEVLGESLIVLSALYIACVLCYMTFLIHRITFTIPLVVIVTGAVVLIEVNIINIYMSPQSAANEKAKAELTHKAHTEYCVDSNEQFSVTYDLISIWGQCCGIVDQYDFQNVLLKYFLPTTSSYEILQVPPTCCKPSYFEKGLEDVVECASSAVGIFNVGCYQTIYIWLRLYCNLYSIVVILQLLDLCIHIILYKKHLSLLSLEETYIQKQQELSKLQ